MNWKPNVKTRAFVLSMFLTMLLSGVVSGQQKSRPSRDYAQVNRLKMYYEIHDSGEPVVLLHGAFMAITDDWMVWISELSKKRKVIAVEMQGHGRTADISRDITYENLSDDVAGLLRFLKIERADIIGYSLGGGGAMQRAIRHPEIVRKVVSISAPYARDGWVNEANDAWLNFTWEVLKGTPAETEWKKLNPTPNGFPGFFNHVKAMALRPYDFGADKLKATKAPMFFIHGDADGVRLDHIAEMYRLKGGDLHGDMRPHPESRLAILPDTTHVTLMNRMTTIVPMINDFLDAKPQTTAAAQQTASQTNPLPCTTENRDPSQPWLQNSKVLDSFPKDNPLPRFIGTFRDKNSKYMLDLYQDAKGVFGELSSPVLDADSPTSRLYDVAFDSRTSLLQFEAKFFDGQLQFSGILGGRTIEATVTRNKHKEKVSLKRERHSAVDEVSFTSRAQFDCAMTLWRRY